MDENESEKIKELQSKIQTLQPGNDSTSPESEDSEKLQQASQMNDGMRAGVELVIPPVIGCFLGLQVDKWLDTAPLFLIILLLIGIGAGFLNVYRITQKIDEDSSS